MTIEQFIPGEFFEIDEKIYRFTHYIDYSSYYAIYYNQDGNKKSVRNKVDYIANTDMMRRAVPYKQSLSYEIY